MNWKKVTQISALKDLTAIGTANVVGSGISGIFWFYLAALIGIPYSYRAPKSYIDTNITGTYNVLSAAKINNVSKERVGNESIQSHSNHLGIYIYKS